MLSGSSEGILAVICSRLVFWWHHVHHTNATNYRSQNVYVADSKTNNWQFATNHLFMWTDIPNDQGKTFLKYVTRHMGYVSLQSTVWLLLLLLVVVVCCPARIKQRCWLKQRLCLYTDLQYLNEQIQVKILNCGLTTRLCIQTLWVTHVLQVELS